MSAGIKKKLNIAQMVQWLAVILTPVFIFLMPEGELFTHSIKIFLMITTAGILVLAFEFFDYGLAAMLGALLLTEVLNET